MRIRTFKEKVKDSYLRNRDIEGKINYMLMNDLEKLIGNLVMIKTEASNISDLTSLRNLGYIDRLVLTDGYITGFQVRRLFIDKDDPIEYETYSLRQIKLLSKITIKQDWFKTAIANVMNRTPDEDKTIRNINTVEMLPIKVTIPSRSSHIFLLGVYSGYIESLETKTTIMETVRNKLFIQPKGQLEIWYPILELTSRTGNIQDFLYRNS